MSRSSPCSQYTWVALCLLLCSLAILAACATSGMATSSAGLPAAATPIPQTDTATMAAGQAQAGATPAATGRPRSTLTPASSSRARPGLTIPTPPRSEGLPTIAFGRLPSQAQDTIRLIANGGPFPYRQDGITFENRERILPQRATGYYKEYTVVTPGSSDRGARRIVAGQQGELYYTDDHYASFKRVVP